MQPAQSIHKEARQDSKHIGLSKRVQQLTFYMKTVFMYSTGESFSHKEKDKLALPWGMLARSLLNLSVSFDYIASIKPSNPVWVPALINCVVGRFQWTGLNWFQVYGSQTNPINLLLMRLYVKPYMGSVTGSSLHLILPISLYLLLQSWFYYVCEYCFLCTSPWMLI